MRRVVRLFLRFALWQAVLAAPVMGLRYALGASGLSRVAPDADEVRVASLADGYELKSEAKAFRGGSVAWLWGGFVLDLRNAGFAPGGADLKLVTVMGGSVIIVPPDLEVSVRQRGFGGGSNVAPTEPGGPAVLRVDAVTIMGGFNLVRRPLETPEAAPEASSEAPSPD